MRQYKKKEMTLMSQCRSRYEFKMKLNYLFSKIPITFDKASILRVFIDAVERKKATKKTSLKRKAKVVKSAADILPTSSSTLSTSFTSSSNQSDPDEVFVIAVQELNPPFGEEEAQKAENTLSKSAKCLQNMKEVVSERFLMAGSPNCSSDSETISTQQSEESMAPEKKKPHWQLWKCLQAKRWKISFHKLALQKKLNLKSEFQIKNSAFFQSLWRCCCRCWQTISRWKDMRNESLPTMVEFVHRVHSESGFRWISVTSNHLVYSQNRPTVERWTAKNWTKLRQPLSRRWNENDWLDWTRWHIWSRKTDVSVPLYWPECLAFVSVWHRNESWTKTNFENQTILWQISIPCTQSSKNRSWTKSRNEGK